LQVFTPSLRSMVPYAFMLCALDAYNDLSK
jgi:hypothetical protein